MVFFCILKSRALVFAAGTLDRFCFFGRSKNANQALPHLVTERAEPVQRLRPRQSARGLGERSTLKQLKCASLERPFKRPGRNDLRSIFQTCWYSCWGDVFYIDTHSQSKQAADRYRAIAKFFAHREDQYTFLEQEAQAASLPFVAYKYETPTRWSSCLLQLISVLQNNPAHALLRPVGTLDTWLCKICAVCEFEVWACVICMLTYLLFSPAQKSKSAQNRLFFRFLPWAGRSGKSTDLQNWTGRRSRKQSSYVLCSSRCDWPPNLLKGKKELLHLSICLCFSKRLKL